MRLVSILLLVGALLAGIAGPSLAQPAGNQSESAAAKLDRWDKEAKRIQARLDKGNVRADEIDAMRATLEAQRAAIPGLVDAVKAELQPLKKQQEALGPKPQPPAQETPEVAKQRRSLDKQISDLEARLKLLGQADARASALLSQLADLRRNLFTRQLLTRGPSPLEPGVATRAFASLSAVAASIAGETSKRVAEARMDTPTIVRVSLETLLVIVTVLLLRGARLALLRRLVRPVGPESPERRRVIAGISTTLVRLLMPVLAVSIIFFAAWNSGFLGPHGKMLLRGLAWTALVMIGAYGLGGAFYSPQAPALRLSQLSEDEAAAAHNWLIGLAAVVGLDRLMVVQGVTLGLSIEALTLLNVALLVPGAIVVWGFALHLHEPEKPEAGAAPGAAPGAGLGAGLGAETTAEDDDERASEQSHDIAIGPLIVATLRFLARAIAVLAPLLALIGYYAASRFLFYPMVFSGAVIGLCVLLFYAVQDAVDGLVRPVETQMAGTPSRIRLIPVFLGFFLICAALPVLALIWGADLTDLSNAWRAISAGFTVGKVTVSPLDFLLFLLVFSVGYVLTRILQGVLRRSVLPVTGLDAGGKAAISAGVYYVGIFLSALVAISATGLDLSNLALVAGALSVGIGFGLQNIVNNFVSGLILLLERPIKAGDWVELSSGMGYVKQINVRSTEIETFDRASLIVPNSELISNTVTNWTHTNLHGRLIVPVSVSYKSDPKQVERILLEVAKGHAMLLRRPPPYVLFRNFGADGLEFEIRGILRDVNWILNVRSDMNFEIARRFAEAGIEIPYPQRDMHLKNTEEVAGAIRRALEGEAAPRPSEHESNLSETSPRRRRPQPPAGFDTDGDS